MTLTSVLREQIGLSNPDPKTLKNLSLLGKKFCRNLEEEFRDERHSVEIFIGGSFAKRTVVKKDKYDVDIFVRFDWRFENISDLLAKALEKIGKEMHLDVVRVHGSRDYFRCYVPDEDYYIEVIPVTKVKTVHEARNVTDLSYFHVSYIKRKIRGLEDQVRLAKVFFAAQRIYGAESYIHGFSGYALECLIIYYGSFVKMLRMLTKVKLGERIVIDPAKLYKKKEDVYFSLNESKLQSPIILIDPTYKDRNVLASLSRETFEKFQNLARDFLTKPDKNFFSPHEINPGILAKKAHKNKSDFLTLQILTDRQPGDIAGTKLKKFSDFLLREIREYYNVLKSEFVYDMHQGAFLYVTARSLGRVIRVGPPTTRGKHFSKHIRAFKGAHKKVYEKNGFLHAEIAVPHDLKKFLESWKAANKEVVLEMGIVGIEFN